MFNGPAIGLNDQASRQHQRRGLLLQIECHDECLQQPAVDCLQHSGRRMGGVVSPELRLGWRQTGWWLANVTQGDGFAQARGTGPGALPAV
jgi:hypothetical protein